MPGARKWSDVYRLGFQLLLAGAVFYVLYLAAQYSYLFFHTTAELFSIIIAFGIFMVAWNARRFLENNTILFLGVAYVFVAVIDFFHTLSYQGMQIFKNLDEANLATELWMAARFLQAVSLAIAPFYANRSLRAGRLLLAYLTVTAVLLASIFIFDIFPDSYITGSGLTAFKSIGEFVIVGLLVFSLWYLIRKEKFFNTNVLRWLVLSIAWTIGSEVIFIRYLGLYDLANMAGHFLKIVAFYMLYRAVVHTGLTQPFELLFQSLQMSRDELRRERDFIETVLDTSYALLMVVDPKGCVVRFNRAMEKVTGYRQTDIQNRSLWETGIFPETRESIQEIQQKGAAADSPLSYDGQILTRDRRVLRIAWSITIQPAKEGEEQHTIWTGLDVTERMQAEDELRYVSTHDSLTGLYNRAFFEAEMIRLAETDHFPASIVIADVDGLKVVNDSFGHLAGDKLLQRAAHILRSAFRAEDVVARMGGDEYAVLLPNADAGVAEHGLRRVQAILSAHNQVNPDFPIQISLGASTAEAGYMLMETFKHADQAMYREKHAHRSHQQ